MKNFVWMLFMGLLLISCKVKKISTATDHTKTATSGTEENSPKGTSKVFDKDAIRKANFEFQTLFIKSNANIQFAQNNYGATLNFRFEKDKKIWVSAVIFGGIEIGRALITPDSIKVLNKFQRQYLSKPFSFVHQYVGEQVDFNALQAMLLGNVPENVWSQKVAFNQQNDSCTLNGKMDQTAFNLLINSSLKPIESKYQEGDNVLNITCTQFQSFGEELPMHIDLNALILNKIFSLKLNYESVQKNIPVEFPFKVPENYSLIN